MNENHDFLTVYYSDETGKEILPEMKGERIYVWYYEF